MEGRKEKEKQGEEHTGKVCLTLSQKFLYTPIPKSVWGGGEITKHHGTPTTRDGLSRERTGSLQHTTQLSEEAAMHATNPQTEQHWESLFMCNLKGLRSLSPSPLSEKQAQNEGRTGKIFAAFPQLCLQNKTVQ